MNIVPHTVCTYIVLLRYGSTVKDKILACYCYIFVCFFGGGDY